MLCRSLFKTSHPLPVTHYCLLGQSPITGTNKVRPPLRYNPSHHFYRRYSPETMSTVHLLQIPLASATDIEKPAWKDLVGKISSASHIAATLWAAQHEEAHIGGIAARWESLEAQKTWAESAEGKAVKTEINGLASGPVYEDVVVFTEDPGPSLTAQVVELVSWIHPADNIDDAKKEKVEYGFKQFQQAISSRSPEADGGLVAGWGQIEFEHKGVASRRFTSFIGWKSVEAHYACKLTAPFTENIHWLMEHGDTGVEMVHYPYRAV